MAQPYQGWIFPCTEGSLCQCLLQGELQAALASKDEALTRSNRAADDLRATVDMLHARLDQANANLAQVGGNVTMHAACCLWLNKLPSDGVCGLLVTRFMP